MLLLARDDIARAHHVDAFRLPALAHPDAAQHGVGEVAAILLVGEFHLRAVRVVVGAQLQVLIDPIRGDDLAGVHLVERIPDALELAHGLDQFRSVLFV